MSEEEPNFQDYRQALERLRRRAHLRRAVMTRGLSSSIEMPVVDGQEIEDQRLCEHWQARHGFMGGF